MSERQQHVTDDGALHNYRTEIPNTIIRGVLGRGLSLPARWLYVYLKSVAGDCGECWQNMTTLTAGSQISRGAVSKARRELVDARLIVVIKGKGAYHETDHIRILDIWRQNMTEFCGEASSPHELGTSSPHEHAIYATRTEPKLDTGGRVHLMNAPSSPGEQPSSPGEQPSSSGERLFKKIPEKKIPDEEVNLNPPTPFAKGGSKKSKTKASQQPNTDYSPSFNKVWALYPRKEKKVDTFTIWRERNLESRAGEIAEKVARLQVTLWKHKEMQYIPLPTTWFNEARYEDDLIPLTTATHSSDNAARRIQDAARATTSVHGPR